MNWQLKVAPDAVAWTALDVPDEHVRGAGPQGDAVVAGAGGGVEDAHVPGVADLDAVGVGAVRRRDDPDALDRHAAAVEDGHVEFLAVEQRQLLHAHALGLANVERLQS